MKKVAFLFLSGLMMVTMVATVTHGEVILEKQVKCLLVLKLPAGVVNIESLGADPEMALDAALTSCRARFGELCERITKEQIYFKQL